MISTPGIGPATDGLSGFSLFCASQAASVIASATDNAAAGTKIDASHGPIPILATAPAALDNLFAGQRPTVCIQNLQ